MYRDTDNRLTVYGTNGFAYAETDGYWGECSKSTNCEFVTGKEPGVFTHFVANEQIYDRHMDNAQEMLRRAAEMEAADAEAEKTGTHALQPRLVLHKEPCCEFSDITLEDFEMLDYEPLKPQLKFELGI